jgi:hypothetical protein
MKTETENVINLTELPLKLDYEPQLRLSDYEVCKLLMPYVGPVIALIEHADLLVDKVAITPEYVRAHIRPSNFKDDPPIADHVEKALPRGLYQRALDLSHGPHTPFPIPAPPEDVKLWLGRLHLVAFPDPNKTKAGTPAVQHVVLNANDYGKVRRWLGPRVDFCTMKDLLVRGFQGDLFEQEKIPGTGMRDGRKVSIWVSQHCPVGKVGIAFTEPGPDWSKASFAEWTNEAYSDLLSEV